MCGEQRSMLRFRMGLVGSPPRVRGTDGRGRGYGDGKRITPACAGNRLLLSGCAGAKGDHPRVCGEQIMMVSPGSKATGSPPRVRGTDQRLLTRLQ